ncbi:MAG: threonine/serine dehydratase [Saprospiraceae bacterium]|nr:threonine/serine dehydratase [Saprospiraceae bacterium]
MTTLEKLERIPTRQDIAETHQAIFEFIHYTPILTCESLNLISGAELFFKCENFQKIGAFKMRGAASASVRLNDEELDQGLATHSSGNHAQAVARAAMLLGVPAYIVMPETAPPVKVAATKGYGAEIIFCKNVEDREPTLQEVVERTGATFIHPYNDYNVIAGQATSALELLQDVEELDVVIAPVGGGGLLSGTALSTRYWSPSTKVIGAEPEAVNDAWRSMQSGQIEVNTTTNTIADGLRTNLGEKTFDIIQKHVDDILTVSEEEIVEAMRLVWERMKIVIEPSCAVPLAAVLRNKERFEGEKIGIILTGGNVDLSKLPF